MNKKISFKKSLKLWNESKKYMVPGSVTISKHPDLCTFGAYPIYAKSGQESIIIDVDGNKYIDFQSALGAIILGMSYQAVSEEVFKQLKIGTLNSISTPLQIELAKKLTALIPSAEKIRFLKNGSDATSAAVRIARAYTGRDIIASCHFHGWHDWFYVATNLNRGIPKKIKNDIVEFEYNNLESLKKIFSKNNNKIAAVIMEPVNLEEPERGYLNKVKELAHKNGALLIFDEVVTGFRFGLGGAQKFFNVTPDISCFAKALANGYPLSMVAGSKKIMDSTEDVITSMTYGEEALSFVASLKTLDILKKKKVVEHIWKLGAYFKEKFNELSQKYKIPIQCIGYPARLEMTFRDIGNNDRLELKAYFLQETAKRGILFGNVIFMNFSHSLDQVKKSLKMCEEVFESINKHGQLKKFPLEGKSTKELW